MVWTHTTLQSLSKMSSLATISECLLSFFLCLTFHPVTDRQRHFILCSVHTQPGSPAIGVLWTTMRTSWEHFTWPSCVLRASRAMPPAPCCHSPLWAFVSGCVNPSLLYKVQYSYIKHYEAALTIFLPPSTVKPDPPSGVKVQQVEGRKTYMKVSWNFPISWKSQDNYYKLIYEIRYKPLKSSFNIEQVCTGRPTDKWLGWAVFEHVSYIHCWCVCLFLTIWSTNPLLDLQTWSNTYTCFSWWQYDVFSWSLVCMCLIRKGRVRPWTQKSLM